ncbi:GNAT family N-acetyltransferase [Cryptosporangium sp. NPDC051539]|uniref:GNAT family N-acetyltransferase n=1 Tax=Cryptosporangium sp. NPDC051539 TaxID=3363962 RepID=UPI0037B3AC6C
MTYQVRRTGPNDFTELKRLRLEALKDSPLAFVEQYDEAAALPDTAWRARAASTDTAWFAAVADGRFVATAGVFAEAEVTVQVSAMLVGVYVTPTVRGGPAGPAVTSAAVDWAFEHLRADVVRLFVLDLNERAKAFYRRLGFTETGHTIRYPPDPTYRELEMAVTTPLRRSAGGSVRRERWPREG